MATLATLASERGTPLPDSHYEAGWVDAGDGIYEIYRIETMGYPCDR
jgi:hypothetical protein